MTIGLALGLCALALGVGIYGSIIGAGGGFVMVAGLVLLFDLAGAEAVGTSVITTLFIQTSGAITYDRKGMVDRPTVKWFTIGSVPVAFAAAAFLANRIPQRTFDILIGVLLVSLAVFVIFGPTTTTSGTTAVAPRRPQLVGLGASMGVLAGAFGAGSGLITVPAIGSLQKLSTHRAAATTAAIGAFGGLAGALGHALADNPRWSFVPWVIAGAIVGGRIGSTMSDQLSERTVQVLLSGGLVAAGLPLLARGL